MKRQHIIEKLTAANYASAYILQGMSNNSLNNLYREVWPRLLTRMERNRRRDFRYEEQRRRERAFRDWNINWCRNWVHPKVQYPLTGPGRLEGRPTLNFGLKDLREEASWLAKNIGDPDASATIRIIDGVKLKREEFHDHKGSGRRGVNHGKRGRGVRVSHDNSVRRQSSPKRVAYVG